MKYSQPYGISDPEGPYVNGNPSTGTMGSIPPAASIEHPQREIVNFLTDAGGVGLTPSASDLHQLAKGIQSGGVNYADDTGTPNQLVVTLVPPPPALRKGLAVYTIVKYDNYVGGPSTLNLNILGAKPIKHLDHTDLKQGELKAGTLALFVYDGTAWQWVSAPYAGIVTGTLLAPRDYYINPATGNDNNDGLTAGTAFRTINNGVSRCTSINLNGYSITLHLANGTYVENVFLYPLNGNGTCHIVGDENIPANCTIAPANGYCIGWGSVFSNIWLVHPWRQTAIHGQRYLSRHGHLRRLRCCRAAKHGIRAVQLLSSCRAVILQDHDRRTIDVLADQRRCRLAHIIMASGSELLNYQPQLLITGTPAFTYFVGSDRAVDCWHALDLDQRFLHRRYDTVLC
jgi:hypothetical protein